MAPIRQRLQIVQLASSLQRTRRSDDHFEAPAVGERLQMALTRNILFEDLVRGCGDRQNWDLKRTLS